MMKFRSYQTLIFVMCSVLLQAQDIRDTVNFSLNAAFNAGMGDTAPFLSTANQYDRYSFAPNSLSMWGTIHKEIKDASAFDYGFGLELDGNVAKTEKRFFPGEIYVQGKIYFLNINAGRKREVFGNQHAELSGGGMLWSRNSRPLPKISIATNGYVGVPFTKGYMEFKGGLSHGWFDDNIGMTNLLLHHKYASFRVGGSLPVTGNIGVQHVAQWGGVSPQYGTMPVTMENYYRIFLGKSGSTSATQSDQINVLGNHIISQEMGLDLNLKSVQVSLYWQNITEDPPVKFMTATPNIADGLFGMAVKFPNFKPLNIFVVEYLRTTDQSGPWHDLDGVIYGGGDGYYFNGQVPGGWSYRGLTMGNPWLSSPKYNQNGSTTITNNLVRLWYFTGNGAFKALNYRMSVAYSENFGSSNPSFGNNLSWENCKKQYSYQLETSTALKFLKSTKVSLSIAGDNGAQYGNNLALILGVTYSGSFGF